METRCGIDTHNPQATKITLAYLTITISKVPAAFDGFTRFPIQFATGPTVALGMLQ